MEKKLIYDIHDRPKFPQLLVFAFQQLLAIMAATLVVPIIIGNGMQPTAALFGAGVGTLIYILFTKAKSPVFLGSSFAFIGSLTSAFTGAFLSAYPETTFCEIFCPDWKENRLLISHMGEMNYSVKKEKPELIRVNFPYGNTGFCFKGVAGFKSGKAVFCNVFKDVNEEFKLLVTDVEMINVDTRTGEYMSRA